MIRVIGVLFALSTSFQVCCRLGQSHALRQYLLLDPQSFQPKCPFLSCFRCLCLTKSHTCSQDLGSLLSFFQNFNFGCRTSEALLNEACSLFKKIVLSQPISDVEMYSILLVSIASLTLRTLHATGLTIVFTDYFYSFISGAFLCDDQDLLKQKIEVGSGYR